MKIALVVAIARNRVIGLNGSMPWRVPGDLKTFRRLTMGHPVIMGRKTFQSLPKALDGRTNIVVTRDPDFAAPGTSIAGSLDEALECARVAAGPDKIVMVIGGGEIYRAALPMADMIYLTQIDAEPAGDTWFPELDPAEWVEIERVQLEPDPRDEFTASLITYKRT